MELNDAQRAAVKHKDGPILVVAGAGTGKTRVIVERIVELIEDGVDPANILAVTFTEKAAQEMLDRVNTARGSYTLDATIATYNGFGDQLLREFGVEFGLSNNLRLLGEIGKLIFLREHLDQLGLDYFAPVSRPDGQLDTISGLISEAKQQLITPEVYAAYAKSLPASTPEEKLEKQKHSELAQAYAAYVRLCREQHVIDYDDQLYLTIELLEQRPNIKRHLQERYRYILVDEFQDTNPMQAKLINLLSGVEDRSSVSNVFVVGDDDQSIYGWRGATLANILDFSKTYKGVEQITLTENYRSTQEILDSAYRLIQHNNPNRLEAMHDLNKKLVAHVDPGPAPRLQRFANLDAELAWVAQDVQTRLEAGQDPGTIAILARRNQSIQRIHESLEMYNVPHTVAGLHTDLYQQVVVAQVIEVLKAIHDPSDNLTLFHVLGGPLGNLPPDTLAKGAATARAEHRPLRQVLQEDAGELLERLDTWRDTAKDLSVGQIAYNILDESGWKDRLYAQAREDADVARQVQALGQLFRTLKEFERIANIPSLQAYLDNLPALQAAGNELKDDSLDISETTVNVLSIHKAKGLEWQTVYVIDCTEGSFPMKNFGSRSLLPSDLVRTAAADEHMAEERRLMYVAATRAKNELVLTFSDTHTGNTPRTPSRFLEELTGHDPKLSQQQAHLEQTTIELFAPLNDERPIQLPSGFLENDKLVLSASQVDCWLRCPQDFYYKYVLQIPQPPNPVLTYGTIVHGFIQRLHTALRDGRDFNLEDELADIQAHLPMAGYHSATQRERAHKQLLETLRTVHDRFSSEGVPRDIELPFRVEVPGTDVILTGRIDAVYEDGKGVEIRDYKTGDGVKTADKAKQRARNSSQLTLYALAWNLLYGEIPSLLTLDFVETHQSGSVKKQAKSLETLTTKIAALAKDLQAGSYPAGTDHAYCIHPL